LKKTVSDYLFLFLFSGSIIVLDQLTKWLVRTNLAFSETWVPWDWLAPYARIVNWRNTGAAFGIFQNLGDVFKILAVVVSVVIIYYFPRVPKNEWYVRVALGMQLAGALGNLISRLTQGYVTDFISLGKFAVFNVADSSISVGVAVLLVGVWINEWRDKRKNTQQPLEATLAPELPPKDDHGGS
jgi:signal peptidase II